MPPKNKNLVFFIPRFVAGLFCALSSIASATDLDIRLSRKSDLMNEVTVINLNKEMRLQPTPIQSRERLTLGFRHLSAGRPHLVTPYQNSAYNFSSERGVMGEWAHRFAHAPRFAFVSSIGYFYQEQNASSAATALHVLPMEMGGRFYLRSAGGHRGPQPFIGAGAMGLLQIQRGPELTKTSEMAGLWVGSMGLQIPTPWDFSFQLGISRIASWEKKASAWSGSTYDLGFTLEL